MQPGQMVFTRMDRVIFGQSAADALVAEAARLDAHRVFVLASATLNQQTDAIERVAAALGARFAGAHDHMPSHSPRSAVVACANAARDAGADLLVTYGGGSVTDGGKAVTICLEHDVTDEDGLEPFRTIVKEGVRQIPDFRGPKVRQIAVPTTLSAGEFNARAGVTDTRLKLKQSFMHKDIIPLSVVLDAESTVHTPEWLWLSTGIRAVDHAVETLCSIDANEYTEGAARQALRLLGQGLPAVKADPGNLEARHQCLMGAWMSMVGIVTGTRLGASHAIGHILGGTANVPHGYTSCVMLPYVLEWNASVNGTQQAAVSESLGQPGRPACDVLDEFIGGLGMPRSLTAVDVTREQLPQLAENCMLDDWTFSNPRKISAPDEVMQILERAL
ncbi:MAG: iron-containing alcohol dehydrogenase [Pseudomonadota bacterium]